MPVRKVKLKDGTVGYQWGTTGKIYKKREDAEKQGIAILLSQRKKRKMKINKELYNELKEKVDSLEKLVNGGKGSGNFGHAGRPGEIGGSAPSGSSTSGTSWMEKYAVSDKDAYDYLDESHGELGITGGLKSLGAAKDGVVKEMAMSLYSALPEKDLMDLARVRLTTEKAETARPKGMKSGSPYNVESFITQAAERLITYAHDIGYRAGFGQGQQAEAETMSKLFDQNYTYIKGRITRAEKTLKSKAKDGGTYGLEYAAEAQGRLNVLKANLDKLRDMEARAKGDVYEQIVKKPFKEKLEQVSWNPSVNSFTPTPQQLAKSLNGGKGSGNFGHAGRPGERGGSAPAQTGVPVTAGKTGVDLYRAIGESNRRQELDKVRADFYRDYLKYEKTEDGRFVRQQPDTNDRAYKEALKKIVENVDSIRELDAKSDDLQTQRDNAKIARIEEKIGKKALLVAKDFEGSPASTFMDEDGKEYWYDKRSERVKDYGGEKEYRSPAFDKAMKDKTPWNEYEITGAQIKKKLKGYGINTEGLTVSKGRGGYETAWHISGDSRKTDLKAVEDIVKTKIGHVDYDERSGEILAGGNTFVFVRDTDKNMLYQKLSNKLDELALAFNGGKGSGNFGHAGRPGEVGGSVPEGSAPKSDADKSGKKPKTEKQLTKEITSLREQASKLFAEKRDLMLETDPEKYSSIPEGLKKEIDALNKKLDETYSKITKLMEERDKLGEKKTTARK